MEIAANAPSPSPPSKSIASEHRSTAAFQRHLDQIIPLERETRTTVDTATAAHHLNRRPQTLRVWACLETYPPGLKPIRVFGRLAWPVAGIRKILGLAA